MAGCIAHAQNGHISTSALKSDVTIVFLNPDFLSVVEILAIRIYLRQIWDYLIFALIFRTSWPKMEVLGERAKWERGGAIFTSNELVFTFVGSYVCANSGESQSRNATVRRTARLTDANRFYNLSHDLCYSLYLWGGYK